MSRLTSERDCQLKAVRDLVQIHSLPKDVAKASVYTAGWSDLKLCLDWARHYKDDTKMIKTNSKRFLLALKGQKETKSDPDTLKSTDEAAKFRENIRKRVSQVIISNKIRHLVYQYHTDCDELAALEAKKQAVDNLVEIYGIEKRIATAAVQAEVVDPEKCLKWAEECGNKVINELFGEYHADAGAIFSLKFKQKFVADLVQQYHVENDVAIAAAQLEFEPDIGKCLQWIRSREKEATDLTSMILKLANSSCPDSVVKQASKFDYSSQSLSDFEKREAAIQNLTQDYEVDFKIATAAVLMLGHEPLEGQLNWSSENRYEVNTINDLFGEYLIQKSFHNERKNMVKNISLKFQIDERFVKAFMTTTDDKSLGSFFLWMSDLAKENVVASTFDMSPIQEVEVENDFDVGLKELQWLEVKENMVSLLIKKCKVTKEIAKASVQQCGTSLFQCKDWVERYESNYHVVKRSLLEYEREHESFADLKAKDVVMTSLIEKHRFDTKLAKAAVQLKGPDIGSCKDWIHSVLKKKPQSEHSKSQKEVVVQSLVEDLEYSWHLATAAVQRCGDQSVDDCLQWIDRNQHLREVVGEASWEYRFWSGLHKSIETFDFGDKPVTSLEHTLSILTKVYRFSPILAQAAVSAQGWGISNIQKCKEWAEVNRENYSEIYKFHNRLEERLKEEIESSFNEKMKQKAIQRKWIGKKGGIIELFGCFVIFPPYAVHSEVEIEISVDSNPEKFPKSCSKIPITPILGCKPPMKFQKPVKIKMQTYYSAKSDEKIPGKVLCKKKREDDWDTIENVTIIDENCITFEVWHFCGYNVAVSDENAAVGTYRLLNDVYIHNRTAQIFSVFTKDEKTQSDLKKSLRDPGGFIQFLPVTNEMYRPIGTNVDLKLECIEPEGTMIPEGRPQSSFQITREFLKNTKYAVYFRMIPRPRGPDEVIIDVRYDVIVDNEEKSYPLLAIWPINLPDTTQAITIHTGPSYVRANQVATGSGASIHVENSTSVVSGTLDGDDEQ